MKNDMSKADKNNHDKNIFYITDDERFADAEEE